MYRPHFFLQSSERDRARGGGGRGWEKQSVGWRCEDKGRMDGCCCQDLSAVTNGCCKDEASKTLENSDVVNHRYECVCVHLCVFYMCLSVCFSDCVGEWKRKCVCACIKVCPKLQGAKPWQGPSKMGECWEIDLGGVWGRQRWICVWLQEKNSKHHEIEMAEQRIAGRKGSERQRQGDREESTQFSRWINQKSKKQLILGTNALLSNVITFLMQDFKADIC